MFAEAVTSRSAPAIVTWRAGSGTSMSKQISGATRRPARSTISSSSPSLNPASAKRARFAPNGSFKYGLRSLLKIAHPPSVAPLADDPSVLAEWQPMPLPAVVCVRAKLAEVDSLLVGRQDALKPLG